ncbi:multicopper oxidase family protein [Streptantibioticus ferralitis]|uniref:Multicopper oxidase family protein n=1 Tax=Streptantibioticus ferralitis TaxID=236510 RepID=A0ABT5Z851_9ACTN|nr:multicopper oxidase family protein [Streptantibioticus ferralitis]MDF2259998.1 multicopper oxidase family protein [Streptantibioticus ferralitis]
MRMYTRRAALGAGFGLAGAGLLAACSTGGPNRPQPSAGGYLSPNGPEVAAAERRRGGGPLRQVRLTAAESTVDLGGPTVRTWSYGDRLPGREIRVTAGDTLEAVLVNHLPKPTTVHWHGLALRNDMDGVPDVTQRAVAAGAQFTYRFAVPRPGTYWLHPHTGVQQDRGLYAPLIVEDPKEPLRYDREWVVVLDDWVDGVDGSTPDAVLTELSGGMSPGMSSGAPGGHGSSDAGGDGMPGMPGMRAMGMATPGPSRMLMGATSRLLGGDAGDVAYPYYLVNGRTADSPETFTAKPGERLRIRIINAGGDTAFRVALGGHRMTVTHADGLPVAHTTADALLLGMGERYDVLVTAGDGAFPLVALAEGKNAVARAVLRTTAGEAPGRDVRPAELDRRPLTAGQLRAAPSAALPARRPDATVPLRLTGGMAKYDWGLNSEKYSPARRLPVRAGDRVRLSFRNDTTMWHPVHLHGHTFALPNGGPRKDTAIVLPRQTLDVDFDADNPGLWMIHCHNVYHAESGMMTLLGYRG